MINIGIDNGVTGTVGIIDEQGIGYLYPIPVKSSLNYQKTKVRHITRIDVGALRKLLTEFLYGGGPPSTVLTKKAARVLIERPMVNPERFDNTMSAVRALEAVIITLESLSLGYDYCDSKQWQKSVLPYISVANKKEYPAKLKKVSLEVGQRLYPYIDWKDRKDADGLLIAHYLKTQHQKSEEK